MNRSRLLVILMTSGGAFLVTFSALRFYYRRRGSPQTKTTQSKEVSEEEARPNKLPSAPELRLDPREETATKEDLARAQIISSLVGDNSSSASFDDSDSVSEEQFISNFIDEVEEEEEDENDGTLEATDLEENDDDQERSRIEDEIETLDFSLPDIPSEGASSILSPTEAEVLVDYLAGGNVNSRLKCLVSIANAASFSANQYLLRRAGCIPVLNDLAQGSDAVVCTHSLNALTNLAVNEENQEHMLETVLVLVSTIEYFHLTRDSELNDDQLKQELSALKALTNLSVTTRYHDNVSPLVPKLLANVDGRAQLRDFASGVLTHSWKVLVNLSSNSAIVNSLLQTKAPSSLIPFLSEAAKRRDASDALRVCYFLANIVDSLNKDSLSLPTGPSSLTLNGDSTAQAFSNDSIHALLSKEDKSTHLRTLLLDLTRHADDNVRQQATRLYTGLFFYWGRKISQGEGARKSSPL